ncbi:hypothetical protein PYW08_013060 [Mythimna loreyi]|uniref:Uncharacterized protein n=1 Tax=Mythimna loreyi TaxID=667449 RepID=A0ACC2Q2J5_9NEOP|nr:hypothetical protein PYW08_013060 [Mythimna loreyi]
MNKNTRTWKILKSLNHHEDTDFDVQKELHFSGVQPEGPPYLRPESPLPSTSYTPLQNVDIIELGNGENGIRHVTEVHVGPEHLPHNHLRPESPQSPTRYILLQNIEITNKNHETVKDYNSLLQDLYISDSDDSTHIELRDECILSESSSFNISSPSVSRNIVAEQAETDTTATPSRYIVTEQAETDTTAAPETESLLPGYQIRKRKRKGQANPKEWKKNERKIKRQKGEPYISSKGVLKPGKAVGEKVCAESCKEKCTEKISEQDRLRIFSCYWDIENVEQKRQYIVSLIKRETPATRKTANPESRRKLTNKYFLKKPSESELIRVCQKFFLSTLNISEMFMRGCFKKLSETNVVESDARGVRGPHNKTPESARQYVKDHINSFPRMPAHYVRKDTKKEYLDQDLNITKMYELYVDKCKMRWNLSK